MKKISTILLLATIVFTSVFYSFKKQDDQLAKDFTVYFQESTVGFLLSYDSLYHYLNSSKSIDIKYARTLFFNTRYGYKRTELMTEYFAPSTAAMLNMALISDVDEYDPNQNTLEPEGLQKIEELLFASDTIVDQEFIVQELKRTRGAVLRLQQVAKTLEPATYQIFEASKQELVRIWTINLTGMDASFTKNAVIETRYAIHTVLEVLSIVAKSSHNRKIVQKINITKSKIEDAEKYLSENNDFDSFNRMLFVKKYINPIYKNIVQLEQLSKYAQSVIPTAINNNAENIFSTEAWNVSYFTNEKRNITNSQQVELGKMLFYDPIVSGNNKRACASCHQPAYGFAEPIAKSMLFEQNGELNRNAPTLLNVGFQKALFLDARTTYLEDQAVEVSLNKNEMHGNFDQLVQKLNGSEEYKLLFKRAFVGTSDTLISKQGIIKVIAAYERSLISMNSRFDQYMRNEKVELSESEINGFNLFMGKAQCGTCHFAPFFNGTVPPNFDETEWEIIGVPENKHNKNVDADLGRFNVAKMEIHKFAFKTPTVRNITYTTPYMHNGVYVNLEEVLDFYNDGGGIGHGYEVPNQTLPSDSLKLTKPEMNDIIAFMGTLNDTVGLTKKPSRLPELKVAGQIVNRKIGGEY